MSFERYSVFTNKAMIKWSLQAATVSCETSNKQIREHFYEKLELIFKQLMDFRNLNRDLVSFGMASNSNAYIYMQILSLYMLIK